MAGSVSADVFESQALILLRQLMADGFEIQVAEPNVLRVRPVDRVTPALRADLQRHKLDLLRLMIPVSDAGVQERRSAFARRLEMALSSGVLVPRLMFREAPYVPRTSHCRNREGPSRRSPCSRRRCASNCHRTGT
jgi:hypothetical protein